MGVRGVVAANWSLMTIMVEGDRLVPQALLLRCRRSPDTNHESSVPNSAAGPTSQGLTGLTTNTHGRMGKQRHTLSRCWRTPSALREHSPSPLFAAARNMSPTISQEKDTPLNLNRNVRPLHVDTSSQPNGSHPPAVWFASTTRQRRMQRELPHGIDQTGNVPPFPLNPRISAVLQYAGVVAVWCLVSSRSGGM